jgi:steroid delta-isomerase-like uncharacterized protein
MPTPAEIAPIVQDCFNRRDGAKLLTLWTDDFRYEGPDVAFSGRQRMLAQEQNLWTAFPDIRCEVSLFLASQERAALITRMTGTHDGPLRMGKDVTIPATGRKVAFTLSVHMIFRDGLIAHERLFYDSAGLMRQLGLMA